MKRPFAPMPGKPIMHPWTFLIAVLGLVLSLAGGAAADTAADRRAAFSRGDYAAALQLVRPAAEQGDAEAQYSLGAMYERGQGMPQDDAQAVAWFRKAADQGYAVAQHNLGFMYDEGRGVPRDNGQALAWYRKAAGQGYAGAQYNLGLMYTQGQGVSQDFGQAYLWFRLAARHTTDSTARERAEANLASIAASMTPAQIAEAQRRAAAWVPTPAASNRMQRE